MYNGEKYIGECVSSLLAQTLIPLEIIIVDDGSTDSTLEKIADACARGDSIKVVTVENNGQGKARNLGLDMCCAGYVMFLDADDLLDPETVELAYEAVSGDKSDFVVFDWKYYYQDTSKYGNAGFAVHTDKKILQGDECLLPLRKSPFFSVNKLYSRDFLNTNEIRYGEWRIYEDVPFWVKACVEAKRVSVIRKPLYTVRLNPHSTTKTRFDTDLHSSGYLFALDESLGVLGRENKPQYVYTYSYFVSKFISYYNDRTPRRNKKEFLRGFVDLMSEKLPMYSGELKGALPYKLCMRLKVFENKKYALMLLICKLTIFHRKHKR